jgi:hypothetical protein
MVFALLALGRPRREEGGEVAEGSGSRVGRKVARPRRMPMMRFSAKMPGRVDNLEACQGPEPHFCECA